jgi:hypothetical protein
MAIEWFLTSSCIRVKQSEMEFMSHTVWILGAFRVGVFLTDTMASYRRFQY